MTGRIPWTRYSGEDVESVLATLISLEERDAIKIRPSRGMVELISSFTLMPKRSMYIKLRNLLKT